jgi:hypothetical protein
MEKISGANYFADGWKSPGGLGNQATLLCDETFLSGSLNAIL